MRTHQVRSNDENHPTGTGHGLAGRPPAAHERVRPLVDVTIWRPPAEAREALCPGDGAQHGRGTTTQNTRVTASAESDLPPHLVFECGAGQFRRKTRLRHRAQLSERANHLPCFRTPVREMAPCRGSYSELNTDNVSIIFSTTVIIPRVPGCSYRV